jgi:hypothetical protein
MNNNNLVIGIVVITFSVASFFGGMKYQQSKVAPVRQFSTMQGRNGFTNGNTVQSGSVKNPGIVGRMGSKPVAGEITEATDKSITVKMLDGGSKIVFISSKTQINKASDAALSDLKKGETVSVFGQENQDGSVTAQNIQLNPRQMMATPSATPGK